VSRRDSEPKPGSGTDAPRARTLAADCAAPAEHADSATLHAVLNCYLREAADVDVVPLEAAPVPADADLAREVETAAVAPLPEIGGRLAAPLRYRSPTDRHLFDRPVYRAGGAGPPTPLDAATLAALVCRELTLAGSGDGRAADNLLARVLASRENVERFVAARADDTDRLYADRVPFRVAEGALPYGHLLHPTPKSRRGIARRNAPTYAPELEGGFRLHYFRADPGIVEQRSARPESAGDWVEAALRESADPGFVAEYVESDGVLLPVHPWQADYLLDRPRVRRAIRAGRLESLGRRGRIFHPTASVRTAYAPGAPFMHKGSLAVRITNAERTNKRPELERGVAIAELLETDLGDDLAERFPRFEVIRDPAYLTLDVGEGAESGFEVVLRENPFAPGANATPVVALCQDGIDSPPRLARLVERIADREGRPTAAVAREWFREYLSISLRPALWLYLERGVGVEAHQQNAVLELEEGYPERFYYRDNQGYYLPESRADDVEALLPGIGERADTVCPDAVADERLRYYLVCNNAFGVINALGVGGVADERDLLADLRAELAAIQRRYGRPTSSLVPDLLEEPSIPCKANLLTRFEGLDELVGSLENQSVYAPIDNPLVTELDAEPTPDSDSHPDP